MLVFLSVALLSPLPTFAQPKKAAQLTNEEARQLLDEGQQLREAKNYRGALQKYQELRSGMSERRLNTTFFVGLAEVYEKTCDLMRAEAEYKIAANREIDRQKVGETLFKEHKDAQAKAKKQLELLQNRMPKINLITQSAPLDTRIFVNNKLVTYRSSPKPLLERQNPGIYWIDAVAGRKLTRFGPVELKEGMELRLTVLGHGDLLAIFDENGLASSRAKDVPGGNPPPIPESSLARGSACAVEEEETAAPPASELPSRTTAARPTIKSPISSPSTTAFMAAGGLLHISAITGAMWFVLTAADSSNKDATTTFGVVSLGTLIMSGSVGAVGFILEPTERPDRAAGRQAAVQPTLSVSVGPGSIGLHGTF
jgi:hypothetical protein